MLAQAPLPPSVSSSTGSDATISGHTGLSARSLRHQKAGDDLVHLLSIASLTDSPPLVEAIIVRLSSITRLCLA